MRQVTLFKVMRVKTLALLKAEAKMSQAERQCQQWQLLFQIGKSNYIIGKGGVNTTFWSKDGSERVLLLPQDMLNQIDVWISGVGEKLFSVVDRDGEVIQRKLTSVEQALSVKAKAGALIYQHQDGKKRKIFKRVQGLMGREWQAIKKESK